MDTLYRCCAGLDVHKRTVVACVRRLGRGGRVRREVRTFGTMTRDLLALSEWLTAAGVTHVAMESTGVYWKPIFNLLEGPFQVLLVNPRHFRGVPGRKTDVKDCEWLAQLLQCGLLRASYIPPRPQRELRELTRQRVQLVAQRAALSNRLQKVLEDANIKLASVATDVLGKSGRLMLRALAQGTRDPKALAELAQGRLQKKLPELEVALHGQVNEQHRFLLGWLLDQVESLEAFLAQLDLQIEKLADPFEDAVQRLDTIPGLDRRGAQALVAEIGAQASAFPTAGDLAAWAGVCPGQNESAGKSRGGRTRKGNRWLRRLLVQAAWAAGRKKHSYLQAQFRRLAGRRGRKRAAVAVGHTLLGIAYHVLRRNTTYQDLGPDYLERLEPDRLTRSLVKRLERLGHKVTLQPADTAA
jgi:transposase